MEEGKGTGPCRRVCVSSWCVWLPPGRAVMHFSPGLCSGSPGRGVWEPESRPAPSAPTDPAFYCGQEPCSSLPSALQGPRAPRAALPPASASAQLPHPTSARHCPASPPARPPRAPARPLAPAPRSSRPAARVSPCVCVRCPHTLPGRSRLARPRLPSSAAASSTSASSCSSRRRCRRRLRGRPTPAQPLAGDGPLPGSRARRAAARPHPGTPKRHVTAPCPPCAPTPAPQAPGATRNFFFFFLRFQPLPPPPQPAVKTPASTLLPSSRFRPLPPATLSEEGEGEAKGKKARSQGKKEGGREKERKRERIERARG